MTGTLQIAQNASNSIEEYVPDFTGQQVITVDCVADQEGSLASNHVKGTYQNGDLKVMLPAVSTNGGNILNLAVRTHSANDAVMAGNHTGSVYGNYIYIVPNGSDKVNFNANVSSLAGLYLNGSVHGNAVQLVSNGVDEWYVLGKN